MSLHTSPLNQEEKVLELSDNRQSFKQQLFDFVRFILTALIIIIPIRIFIAQPFIVSGSSMVPTFEDKDYLIVDQVSYRFSEPERSDVIIMRYPLEPQAFFIKRVVGLPGETINIRDGNIYIKEVSASQSFLLDESYLTNKTPNDDALTVTLNDDEYFVMGDNRPASSDSRVWGVLPRKNIVGKPLIRLFPTSSFDLHPGLFEIPLTEITLKQ